MKTLAISFLILAGAVTTATALEGPVSVRAERQPLRYHETEPIIYPQALLFRGIVSGAARVVVSVDATGTLTDILPVGYSHAEFADAAVRGLKRWSYDPIRINGVPVPSQVEIAIDFAAQGVVMSIDASTDLTARLLAFKRDQGYAPCPMRDLDAIPTPLEAAAPPYPADLLKRGVRGSATVDFYIDETGAVRMAALQSADFWELGDLAVMAVNQWKFSPPTRHGRPVLVKVQQRFNFGPPES